jgi:hypothetical protein
VDIYEENTHSFVVKVWVEEPQPDVRRPLWRGHITHVMSNQQRYFQSLDDVNDFIAGYLRQSGVKLPAVERLKRWIRRVTRSEARRT